MDINLPTKSMQDAIKKDTEALLSKSVSVNGAFDITNSVHLPFRKTGDTAGVLCDIKGRGYGQIFISNTTGSTISGTSTIIVTIDGVPEETKFVNLNPNTTFVYGLSSSLNSIGKWGQHRVATASAALPSGIALPCHGFQKSLKVELFAAININLNMHAEIQLG